MTRWWLLLRRCGADLRLLWFALRHPDRPAWLLPVLAALGFFALDPLNLAAPVLGVVDDLVLLPLLVRAVAARLPATVRADHARR